MSMGILFMAVTGAVIVCWVLVQRLKAKPWLEQGPLDELDRGPPAKTGLVLFLAVVTSLFGLFISAYVTRMEVPDWTPLTEPTLLWFTTGLLVAASITFQWGRRASESGRLGGAQVAVLVAGIFSIAFVIGQLAVCKGLYDAGYFLNDNPANAFFYLFTGLHSLHLLGGLWVWGRTTAKLWGGVPQGEMESVQLSVQLCSLYWHFLLLVWLVLFWLLLST